ncbi:MAG: globin domain-containing protein [Neomegalonema sp.]|nr:globin domain-containing protein [Neomegalonema sp.]
MGFFNQLFGSLFKKPDAPALTAEQIDQIQASFAKVQPIAGIAAEIFYARLFTIAPEVQPLFKGEPGSPEMAEQGKKLMATLAVVVNGLKDLDAIAPTAAALAQRHVEYGVKPEHYDKVGEALLFTLEKGLGDAFTPELKAGWASAYGVLAGAMISAAYPGYRRKAA